MPRVPRSDSSCLSSLYLPEAVPLRQGGFAEGKIKDIKAGRDF